MSVASLPAASPVLAASNVHVTFASKQGPVRALDGLDLEIPAGALFVLLGPNGAGKTTLMRCITGLVQPDEGLLAVFGNSMPGAADRTRLGRMGVLIENPGLYGRLDAREYLGFFGSFYGLADVQNRITSLCGELGLVLDGKPVAKLSQGNRQKLQLARSLLHRPDLLLWDEPTDHLDPVSQRQVLAYLRRYLGETGATALVATHRLEQMETVATHFGFLSNGKIRRSGLREAILGDATGWEAVRLTFIRPLNPGELDALAAEFGLRIEYGLVGQAEIRAPELRGRLPMIIKALVGRDLPLVSVEPQRRSLNDAYEQWAGP